MDPKIKGESRNRRLDMFQDPMIDFNWDEANESDGSEDGEERNLLTERGAPYGGMKTSTYELIMRSLSHQHPSTSRDHGYRLRNNLLIAKKSGDQERYVLMEGEVEMLWQQCHLQCGHSLRRPLFNLLSSMFTYGPDGGSMWVDASTVRANCFECQRLSRKSSINEESFDWKDVRVLVESGSGVPGDRIRVRLQGTQSVDGHNKRVSKLAAKLGPETIYAHSVPRIRYTSLLRYKIQNEFPSSCNDHEKRVLEAHSREFLVDETDSRVLVWAQVKAHPILICSEETFEIAQAAHRMLEHIDDECIAEILCKTVYWRGMNRSLRTVAQLCPKCRSLSSIQRRKLSNPLLKDSEFGINITFLSNGRRKFDLDYGNIPQNLLKVPGNQEIFEKSVEKPLSPVKKTPTKRAISSGDKVESSSETMDDGQESINTKSIKKSLPEPPAVKRKSPRKPQNGLQETPQKASRSPNKAKIYKMMKEELEEEKSITCSLSEEEIHITNDQIKTSKSEESRCILKTDFGRILCPIGYKPSQPIQAKAIWETNELDTTCVKRLSFSMIQASQEEIISYNSIHQNQSKLDGTTMETIVGQVVIPDGYDCIGYRTENEVNGDRLELVIDMKLRKI